MQKREVIQLMTACDRTDFESEIAPVFKRNLAMSFTESPSNFFAITVMP
jgi:hypothetical protein